MRWVEVNNSKPGLDGFCVSTAFVLRRYRDVFPLLKLTQEITEQMDQTPGIIRYALSARFFTRKFRTLSVWQDKPSMQLFISSVLHAKAIKQFERWGASIAFAEWPSKNMMPDWREADRRLQDPDSACNLSQNRTV